MQNYIAVIPEENVKVLQKPSSNINNNNNNNNDQNQNNYNLTKSNKLKDKYIIDSDEKSIKNVKFQEEKGNVKDGIMNQPKSKEFKWNPKEVSERFAIDNYERPKDSLAEKFGPSLEEIQLNLPTDYDVSTNWDAAIMPKKLRQGLNLDESIKSNVNDTDDDKKSCMGFRGRYNKSNRKTAYEQQRKNLQNM
jgi:hypothetical protein